MSSPADISFNPVNVLLPIYFDVSGINTSLFGQLVDVSGTIIRVREKIHLNCLYDQSGSLINYRQDDEEDIFEVDISANYSDRLAQDISAALHIYEGASYDIDKRGISKLDASLVFLDAENTFTQYNSLQDFVLSYFANKVLGHPGALSAISNDSMIRDNTSAIFDVSNMRTKLSSLSKEEGTMTDNDAKFIVQQVMNQDLARFNGIDKRSDGYTPLPFVVGDKFYIQIRMSNNTYSLKNTIANPTTISTGLLYPDSSSAPEGTIQAIPDEQDQYLLEFMVGTAISGVEERNDF
jgi:hypothetical protein